MKPSPLLLTISTLWALCGAHPARSEDMALNFDLPVIHPPPVSTAAGPEAAPPKAESIQPLPIPPGATNPPMRFHSPQQLPQGVYRRSVAVSLNQGSAPAAILPPAPPLTPAPQAVALRPPADPPPSPDRPSSTLENQVDEVVLSFDVTPVPETLLAQPERPKLASADELLGALFEGEVNSLVARAVGSAEGTRTPTGDLTPAYYGHVDPGNQVWNMGTFSYQHGAKSAAEADQKQLKRLQSQSRILQQRALKQGLTLTLEETLNGIDLANQSPLAAIGRVGYIERLAEAKRMGYEGTEAIVVARTRSYINPDTQQWNAPGLGNTEAGISRDQRRRASQIARAIGAFSQEQPDLNPQTWVLQPVTEETSAPKPEASQPEADSPEPVDIIFQLWTDRPEPPRPGQADLAASERPAIAPAPAPPLSAPGVDLAADGRNGAPQASDQHDSALATTVSEQSENSPPVEPALTPSPPAVALPSAPAAAPPPDLVPNRSADAPEDLNPPLASPINPKPEGSAPSLTQSPGAIPDSILYFPSAMAAREGFATSDLPSTADPDEDAAPGTVTAEKLP